MVMASVTLKHYLHHKILDRIVALGKSALKALMKFFGVEVDYVTASGPDIIFGKMS